MFSVWLHIYLVVSWGKMTIIYHCILSTLCTCICVWVHMIKQWGLFVSIDIFFLRKFNSNAISLSVRKWAQLSVWQFLVLLHIQETEVFSALSKHCFGPETIYCKKPDHSISFYWKVQDVFRHLWGEKDWVCDSYYF